MAGTTTPELATVVSSFNYVGRLACCGTAKSLQAVFMVHSNRSANVPRVAPDKICEKARI